jgi:Tol biopolymer transport system component
MVGQLMLVMIIMVGGALWIGLTAPSDTVAFVAPIDQYPQLFTVDADTRLIVQLSDLGRDRIYNIGSIDWSPNGRQIIMEYWEASNSEVLLYDLRTKSFELVYETPTPDRTPRWSPDGQQILFTAFGNQETTLSLLDKDTLAITPLQVVPSTINFRTYSWSPNGSQIAYYADGLHVLDVTDSNSRQIAVGYAIVDTEPIRWSPNSRQIAFTAVNDDGWRNIYLIDIADDVVTPILTNPYDEFRPMWLPNGRSLLYQTFEPTPQTRRLNLRTGDTVTVTGARPADAQLSPDGRFMLYPQPNSPNPGSGATLFVENIRTGSIIRLTPPTLNARDAVWQP